MASMFYVLQVHTGEEERVKRLILNGLIQCGLASTGTLHLPRRELEIRKRGKRCKEQRPIYPGYLFWESENFNPDIYWAVRNIHGMYKFLKSNTQIEPLQGEDLSILQKFLKTGDVVGKSLVTFDENNKIIVKEGPLKGLEGRIIKVDKRKKRAKIRLDVYENGFEVDFGFELLESSGK